MSERDRDGYYSLLGLTPDASAEQVYANYKAALKAADGPGLEFVSRAAERAYAVLGDSVSRAVYDPVWAKLAEPRQPYRSSEDDANCTPPEDDLSSTGSRGWVGSDDDAGGDYPSNRSYGYSPGCHYSRSRDPLGYYQLLLVSMDATDEEIYTVYHVRFIRNPPSSLSYEDRLAARDAFEVLSDHARRTAYDPAWRLPSNQKRSRPGMIYADYLRAGGTPHSAERPFPPYKADGCFGVFVLFIGVILFFA